MVHDLELRVSSARGCGPGARGCAWVMAHTACRRPPPPRMSIGPQIINARLSSQHPTPYTQHPTPYNLHFTPFTLHTKVNRKHRRLANRRFRDPWCALQITGLRRAPVQTIVSKKDDLKRLWGLVLPGPGVNCKPVHQKGIFQDDYVILIDVKITCQPCEMTVKEASPCNPPPEAPSSRFYF